MYTNEQLKKFTKPISDSEDQTCLNAINMIKDAIKSYNWDAVGIDSNIHVGLKGSYASNTNVKADSDVDIFVNFSSSHYIVDTASQSICRQTHKGGGYPFSKFREELGNALKQKFGSEFVMQGNKAFKIKSNSYRVEADVLPCVAAMPNINDVYSFGVCFIPQNSGSLIINYPKQNDSNGKNKNTNTKLSYKKVVRIMKNIRNDIIEEKSSSIEYPSYMVECLIYNVDDYIFNTYSPSDFSFVQDYKNLIYKVIENIYNKCLHSPNDLYEVNGIKKLFAEYQPWEVDVAIDFLINVYNRLD